MIQSIYTMKGTLAAFVVRLSTVFQSFTFSLRLMKWAWAPTLRASLMTLSLDVLAQTLLGVQQFGDDLLAGELHAVPHLA